MNQEKERTKFTLSSMGMIQSSLVISFRMVFSNWPYIILGSVISAIFWIISSFFGQLLFFTPIVIFYLPDDAVVGFIVSNITAILLGVVISMNVYVFRHSKLNISMGSLFSGSSLSVISSTCASCSSLGFFLVSTLGGAGITASTFLSNYEIPLRVVSVGLLIWALLSISNKLTKRCKINYHR